MALVGPCSPATWTRNPTGLCLGLSLGLACESSVLIEDRVSKKAAPLRGLCDPRTHPFQELHLPGQFPRLMGLRKGVKRGCEKHPQRKEIPLLTEKDSSTTSLTTPVVTLWACNGPLRMVQSHRQSWTSFLEALTDSIHLCPSRSQFLGPGSVPVIAVQSGARFGTWCLMMWSLAS